MKTVSQKEQVLDLLLGGDAITPILALNLFGCFRLAVAIDRLRKEGYAIKTEIVRENGKSWAKYTLPKE